MVTLLCPCLIALLWLMSGMYCEPNRDAINTVVTLVHRDVELIFSIPKQLDSVLYIKSKKNDTMVNFAFVKIEADLTMTVAPFGTLESKLHDLRLRNGEVRFTFRHVQLDDAGVYWCMDILEVKFTGCGCLLVVVDKPNKPRVAPIDDFSNTRQRELQCKHFSSSLPVFHELKHVVKWSTEDGVPLESDAYHRLVIDDKGNLQIKDIQSFSTGLVVTCRTADLVQNETTLLFSDPSPPFTVMPKGTDHSNLVWLSIPALIIVLIVFITTFAKHISKKTLVLDSDDVQGAEENFDMGLGLEERPKPSPSGFSMESKID